MAWHPDRARCGWRSTNATNWAAISWPDYMTAVARGRLLRLAVQLHRQYGLARDELERRNIYTEGAS
jgi:hypothetical protein